MRDLVGGDLRKASIEYDPNGSLDDSQVAGNGYGLVWRFLGWEPDDPRLPDYESTAMRLVWRSKFVTSLTERRIRITTS